MERAAETGPMLIDDTGVAGNEYDIEYHMRLKGMMKHEKSHPGVAFLHAIAKTERR